MNLMAEEFAIGIDLGTTTCNIAVFERHLNKISVIPCKTTGSESMPSMIAFTAKDRITFQEAKNQIWKNVQNTVYESKRLLGRGFRDPAIQCDLKKPFSIVNRKGKPKIMVQYRNKSEEFHIEHIAAMLLSGLREQADKFLNSTVKKAVITVPATFTDGQRQATIDAGTIAGLEVLRIMNEPVAAAIAHDDATQMKIDEKVLVYDLGGGTFDVSIVRKTEDGSFDVIAKAGDRHLGGADFDQILIDYVKNEFTKNTRKVIPDVQKNLYRLKKACETAKCNLSSKYEDEINIPCIVDDVDLRLKLTRIELEKLFKEKLEKTIMITQGCLDDVKLAATSIHQVVVVGGSSRIPKIKELLGSLFGEDRIFIPENPDTYVAKGAAKLANKLKDIKGEKIHVLEKTVSSIGVETENVSMDILIKRNHAFPCKVTQKYCNLHDNQRTIDIYVYEGEDEWTKNNELIGNFELSGISASRAYSETIEVEFSIDDDGILRVTARDQNRKQSNSISINADRGRLTPEEIEQLKEYERNVRKCKKEERRRNAAKSAIESAIYDLEDIPGTEAVCEAAKTWLLNNPEANIDDLEVQLAILRRYYK